MCSHFKSEGVTDSEVHDLGKGLTVWYGIVDGKLGVHCPLSVVLSLCPSSSTLNPLCQFSPPA